jgi:Zn-dependent peptidase ImmA (M78 family)
VDCLGCTDLSGALEFRRDEYVEARSSAYYRVSTQLAARRNVDMERARYDKEEHSAVCASHAQRKFG